MPLCQIPLNISNTELYRLKLKILMHQRPGEHLSKLLLLSYSVFMAPNRGAAYMYNQQKDQASVKFYLIPSLCMAGP